MAPGAGHARAYEDRPPPGYTGGFGEPTCTLCHSDHEPSTEGLALTGLPVRFEPGVTYRLTLTLSDDVMERAGFQTAVRFTDGGRAGAQAGTLAPADATTVATDSAGVTYLHHVAGGTATPERRAEWSFAWTAPETGGRIALHAAANAANGDLSPIGDLIVTAAFESRSR